MATSEGSKAVKEASGWTVDAVIDFQGAGNQPLDIPIDLIPRPGVNKPVAGNEQANGQCRRTRRAGRAFSELEGA